jgi:hypothetical protein
MPPERLETAEERILSQLEKEPSEEVRAVAWKALEALYGLKKVRTETEMTTTKNSVAQVQTIMVLNSLSTYRRTFYRCLCNWRMANRDRRGHCDLRLKLCPLGSHSKNQRPDQ